MAIIHCTGVTLTFGSPPLLDEAQFTLEPNERVCLVGRNGCGKSSFLKVLAGIYTPERGQVKVQPDSPLAFLGQELPQEIKGTVAEALASPFKAVSNHLTNYHLLIREAAGNPSDAQLEQLQALQSLLEQQKAWGIQRLISMVAHQLKLPLEKNIDALSGGMKRRTLLGQALVTQPQILLLDEPTNHLDIDSIQWLEKYLQSYNGSLIFVTHDRMFLRNLATRIVELDRGKFRSFPGDYDTYLKKKSHLLETEAKHLEQFKSVLTQEEVWIRKGIQARRTRNEGRVKRLKEMREEYKEKRSLAGTPTFKLAASQTSGKDVVTASNVSFAYNQEPIIESFSYRMIRGERIGLIGPNGCGKTTLLNLLLGKLTPTEGTINLGTKLSIAYFDQYRHTLDHNTTVREAVADGSDFVEPQGVRKHVLGYLKEFLFTPDRALSPVRTLSGGERNRLLLAKLFAKPFNLLVLDEPTNDLDVETLELMEELLLEYKGSLLVVSHDRAFLNQVVTSTLRITPNHQVKSFVGSYDDWLRQETESPSQSLTTKTKTKKQRCKPKGQRKRTYKETQELVALPQMIEDFEMEQEELNTKLASPNFYKNNGALVAQTNERLLEIDGLLQTAYARWEELESLPPS